MAYLRHVVCSNLARLLRGEPDWSGASPNKLKRKRQIVSSYHIVLLHIRIIELSYFCPILQLSSISRFWTNKNSFISKQDSG